MAECPGYPARRQALQGQRLDWLARYEQTVTGLDGKLMGSFCVSVAARTIVMVDPSFTYTGMLLGCKQPTNNILAQCSVYKILQ